MTVKLDSRTAPESVSPTTLDRMSKSDREAARRRLDTMLGISNPVPGQLPFYERASAEEWVAALDLWASTLDPDTPVLLDDSREIIYED